MRGVRPFAGRAAKRLPAVIGCDEVGRGALCGPVVVAAVWFEPDCLPRGLLALLDDSKRIARAERELLHAKLGECVRFAFAARSARAIDLYGIRNMTLSAMRAAVTRLGVDAPVRFDGVDVPPGLAGDCRAVVRGDSIVPQIAAASILAKVARDRMMARLAERHPVYGWGQNSGYGTAAHRAAIVAAGHTRHHRTSFGDLFAGLNEKGRAA
ncbi:ribonuclease HII [Sphingomonas naphthae]|uniref:Ribonuclease n=1 Tax=Sphingomonas naphthae TaxID=1813468 RepID=A0ABY7TPB8_9SPHN|nr:ribonuclease HII [Sphingomonas naphthae]WCT75082.1 ribonuclease HII [Sphingomonas naphthae]